ncbi:MAG: alpha-L-arabinofuranosidase C-terminal domain-containing protein [Phycisphaerae bacterium]
MLQRKRLNQTIACAQRSQRPTAGALGGVNATVTRMLPFTTSLTRHATAMLLCCGLMVLVAGRAMAQSPGPRAAHATMTVNVAQPLHPISPILYGLMTEEINNSYDGGLYAELIQNRAFKDNASHPVHWSLVTSGNAAATMKLDELNTPNHTGLTSSLKIDVASVGTGGSAGAANDGYWGIPATPDTTYKATIYARAAAGFSGPLTLSIESKDGSSVLASAQISGITTDWKKFTATLHTAADIKPASNNLFVVSAHSPGTIWLGYVSLFPPTYKNQANGFRIDIMKKLKAMRPSFLRFPGGNYLEGSSIADRFNWKKTIGPVTQRPGHWSCWGYPSSDGMGLLEFLMWCQDLHMQPVLAVYDGFSLNHEHVSTKAAMQPFIKSALEEIQYVTGSVNTRWGAVRAKDGHPKPFKLNYVEIGNEDFFDNSGSYAMRFSTMARAIRAKYPNIKLIATVHAADFDGVKPDLVDDHFYRSATAMWDDTHHYDQLPPGFPKIFVGEWATTEGHPTPTLNAALGDAAWLTGLERDSNNVIMCSYAPLLVNVNRAEWGTNLIGYNALHCFGSPSYYMQVMFSQNKGSVVLPLTTQYSSHLSQSMGGAIGVGTWNTAAEFKDIKVTRGAKVLYQSNFAADGKSGWHFRSGNWQVKNGALEQTDIATNKTAFIGGNNWKNYTLSLKARKISGDEGFLISFCSHNENTPSWWNIGGWGNTREGLEMPGAPGDFHPSHIQTGKWYNIRIKVGDGRVRCYLDGRLIHDVKIQGERPLRATASRDNRTGDVILKVVNISNRPVSTAISLNGAGSVASTGKCIVLTGPRNAQNSIADPHNVVPVEHIMHNVAADFTHVFPPRSVNVLRFHATAAGQ